MRKQDQPNDRVHVNRDPLCPQGVSRRIVVVPAQENPLYEKVIYVVRDEAASRGVTAQEVLEEARTILKQDAFEIGEPMDMQESAEDAERVSRILIALSGVALALSGGVLVYWFFAM